MHSHAICVHQHALCAHQHDAAEALAVGGLVDADGLAAGGLVAVDGGLVTAVDGGLVNDADGVMTAVDGGLMAADGVVVLFESCVRLAWSSFLSGSVAMGAGAWVEICGALWLDAAVLADLAVYAVFAVLVVVAVMGVLFVLLHVTQDQDHCLLLC